jgi:hypothetical protein
MGTHIQVSIQEGHMKTTVEISDALLHDARKFAASEGVTLKTLIERGLHGVITQRKSSKPFTLRDASFAGGGLQPEFQDASWDGLREATYQGRGG